MTVSKQKQHIYIIYIQCINKLFPNVCRAEKGNVFQFGRSLYVDPHTILVHKVLAGRFSFYVEITSHPVGCFRDPTAHLATPSVLWQVHCFVPFLGAWCNLRRCYLWLRLWLSTSTWLSVFGFHNSMEIEGWLRALLDFDSLIVTFLLGGLRILLPSNFWESWGCWWVYVASVFATNSDKYLRASCLNLYFACLKN